MFQLTLLLKMLTLDSPIVEALASAASVVVGMRLEVFVEVECTPTAVLVRGLGVGNLELPPVALADRGEGRWAGIVEVPLVENIRLGFEFIPVRGEALVSELHTLTDLGVDRAIFNSDAGSPGFGAESPPGTPQGRRWGWLGLAAGAGALTLVALWTIVGSRGSDNDEVAAVEPDADPAEVPPAVD